MELENNTGPDASRGASAHHAPQNAALRATQQTLHAAKLRIAELEAALAAERSRHPGGLDWRVESARSL